MTRCVLVIVHCSTAITDLHFATDRYWLLYTHVYIWDETLLKTTVINLKRGTVDPMNGLNYSTIP